MTIYLLNILFTFLVCAWIDYANRKGTRRRGLFLLLIVWSTIYALRYRVGTDWGTYYRSYTYTIPYAGTRAEYVAMQRDYLFASIEYFIYQWTNGNWTVFQYVAAFLTYTPILYVIGKRAEKVTVPCLLYIFRMSFYSAFNGMRQAIACGFILIAYYLYVDKKFFKYILFMAIAYGFHSSALFALPFHFLAHRKLRSWFTFTLTLGMIVLYFALERVWPTVINVLERLGQTKMAEDYAELPEKGSSLLRFLVAASPVFLGWICLRKKAVTDKEFQSETALLIYASIFMIYSMHYWIFARVSSLLSAPVILYVPKLGAVFPPRFRKLGMFLICALYFVLMILLLLIGEGNYYPYRING